ncbi:MAG: hypothetical protein SVG88_13035 [Halobacteriales archaeon]|nr:hypothetical protein [Halobacteriales archaeon]
MGIVDSVKRVFVSEGKDVYQCDECEETFKVDPDADDPTCPECESTELTVLNRV